jgi:hypothetical protein
MLVTVYTSVETRLGAVGRTVSFTRDVMPRDDPIAQFLDRPRGREKRGTVGFRDASVSYGVVVFVLAFVQFTRRSGTILTLQESLQSSPKNGFPHH